MNSTNNISARDSYHHARNLLAKAMLDKFGGNWASARQWAENTKLSQSEVRCEVKLTTSGNVFTFGVTTADANTDNAVYNTEQRLNQQDTFVVTEYGLFVRNPASATSTVDFLLTYPNANIFTTANVASALRGTFYSHGQFSMKVNNDVIIPSRGIFNHLWVPVTQQSGVTASATVALYNDQVRGAEDGFVTCEPNIVLIGNKKYVPQINLPVPLAAAESHQRVVLIFRGLLGQNSTVMS